MKISTRALTALRERITRGKWSSFRDRRTGEARVACTEDARQGSAYYTADLFSSSDDGDHAMANAKLMGLSPELLDEVLQRRGDGRDRLASAALEHVLAKERVRELTAQRNALECEREWRQGEPFDEDPRVVGYPLGEQTEPTRPDGRDLTQPCWKLLDSGVDWHDPVPAGGDPPEWCPSCRRRQELHEALRRARPHVGGTYLALRVAAKAVTT